MVVYRPAFKGAHLFRGFAVIGCLKCHELQIVRMGDRKTRTCPKCGYRIRLDFKRVRIWHKSKDLKEAEYALEQLKLRKSRVRDIHKVKVWTGKNNREVKKNG